jgi:hypothetical protein
MRKVQLAAALLALGFFLTLGATAVQAKEKAAHKKGTHRVHGVITSVEQDKDGKVTSFTVALHRHHKKGKKAVAKEMKFNLDGKTKFIARGKLKKSFDVSKLAKGEKVRILARGDHADRVLIKKMRVAKKDHLRTKKVKNARAAEPAK